jgi:hypothetical protein
VQRGQPAAVAVGTGVPEKLRSHLTGNQSAEEFRQWCSLGFEELMMFLPGYLL